MPEDVFQKLLLQLNSHPSFEKLALILGLITAIQQQMLRKSVQTWYHQFSRGSVCTVELAISHL